MTTRFGWGGTIELCLSKYGARPVFHQPMPVCEAVLETHPESPPATMGAPVSAGRTADWKISKKLKRFLTFLVSMILHRYVHPRRTLHYPPAGHPPPGRHGAGVRQHPPALGLCPRPGTRRDGHLEGGRPHPPAVGAFAGS